MVCEIENWDKKEYINELKKMLNSIDTSNKKKAQQKQALIDMMRGDEEIGLYDDNPKNH